MLSKVKQARDRIEALRLALLGSSPDEILRALPGLEEAVRCLETVEQELREGACAPFEVRRELTLFKRDLRSNARLIGHGVQFCRRWASMLGNGPAYTQAGRSVPNEQLATVSFRG